MKKKSTLGKVFDGFSSKVTKVSGSPTTFIVACLLIICWGITGPLFDYSDTWQLIINTSTTIITFLMVFVIQQTQNKDTMAVHLKLNELIKSNEEASNRLIDIEDLTEDELNTLKSFYVKLATLAKKDTSLVGTHSIEEAFDNHEEKLREVKQPLKEKEESYHRQRPANKPKPQAAGQKRQAPAAANSSAAGDAETEKKPAQKRRNNNRRPKASSNKGGENKAPETAS